MSFTIDSKSIQTEKHSDKSNFLQKKQKVNLRQLIEEML